MYANIKITPAGKRINPGLVLSVYLLIFFTSLFSQADVSFEKYSVKEGLSSSVVNCICQDRYGFLWLGTENGLNRFDGYKFKVYKNDPSDSTSIPGDNIISVMEDHEGNIWVGGFEVLAKYDRKTNQFIRFSIEKYYSDPTVVLSIIEDSQNRKWVATDLFGIQLVDEKRKVCRIIDKADSTVSTEWGIVSTAIETRDGDIIVGDLKMSWQDPKVASSGLFKFDEIHRKFERIKNIPEDISDSTTVIMEDDFRNLWFGGYREGEISVFDRHTSQLKRVMLSTHRRPIKAIRKIFKDNDGYLWIGTLSGLIKYNPVSNKKEYYFNDLTNPNSISSNQIADIFQDSFGQLWIGTMDGGINKLDPGRQPIHSYKLPNKKQKLIPIDAISCITTSPEDEHIVWIGTSGNGLYRFNRNINEYDVFRYDKNNTKSISSNNIISLGWDNSGNLWVGSDSTLSKINVNSKVVTRVFVNNVLLDGEKSSANEIISDKTGKLWLATNHGVDVFIPQSGSLKRLPNIMNRRYNKQIVEDMIKTVKTTPPIKSILRVGNLQNLSKSFEIQKTTKTLAICLGEGRVGFNIKNWGDYGWIEDEKGNTVWGMNDVGKTFSYGGGFKNRIQINTLELPPGKYKMRYKSDQGYNYGAWTNTIRPPLDSLLWGIQLIPIDDEKYQMFSNLLQKEMVRKEAPFEDALSIEFSKIFENVIWIGTNHRGIFKYNYKNDQYQQFKPVPDDSNPLNHCTKIVEDDYGLIWFTTPSGLGKLNPVENQITFITEKDGLPANNVKGLLFDNYKNIWVSSIVGLSEIIRESENELSSIINLTTQDGLQGFQFSFAAHKSKSGELFFGGNNGFNSFYSGRTNKIAPLIAITDLKIGLQTDNYENNAVYVTDPNKIEEVILPYYQNDLSFEFAPIHFAHPERNRILYKLVGLNSRWEKDNRKFAAYANLRPGDYSFELKASNGDGIWNDKIKKIKITILTPWWQTGWAYGFYLFAFLLSLYSVRRLEMKRQFKNARIKESELKAKAAELQAKAAEAQNRAIQAENERKSKELEEARSLQLSLLPKDVPVYPHLQISTYMKTATEVGGDYYDFSTNKDGSLNVAIGDATGHGMKAGTLVTAMKALFSSGSSEVGIKAFFESVNKGLKRMQMERVMMSFAMLNINDYRAEMINAGMPPIYHYQQKSKEVTEIKISGMPLGAMEKTTYEKIDITLSKGDALLMLSDGMPELKNNTDEMFGYERLVSHFKQVAEKSAEEIIAYLKNAGSDWVNDTDPDDDVTFVVIKIK